MYLNHFGLTEAPYRITPHTDFFFEGANRGATLEALLYAITHDEGIVKVTGEVGSGKTMLCRVLMERLPAQVETIYLANPSLARDEIMLAILDDLDVPNAGDRSSLILRSLQERLVTLYAEGRRVVVLIDEAHAMPVETLEEIRLLSNLESKRHKLLQIVLFGQQELDEVLGTPQMRQLKERVIHSFRLEPLVRSDIGTYLMFRMRLAGYKGPDIFSDGAVRLITDASEGLTRRVNILADKALLAAFADGGYQVLPKHVNAAIGDSEFARLRRKPGAGLSALGLSRAGLSTIGLAVVAVGLIAAGAATALLAVYITFIRPSAVADRAPPDPPMAAGSALATGPAAGPAVAAHPASSERDRLAKSTPAGPKNLLTQPVPTPQPATPAAAPVSSPAAAPAPDNTRAVPAEALPQIQAAATAPPAAAAPVAEATGLLAQRQRATEEWLRQAPHSTYTLQLLTADVARAADVNLWLTRLPTGIKVDQVYIYSSVIRGLPRFSILYGAFPDRASAKAALGELPKKMRDGKPLIRTIAGIRANLQSQ